MLSSRVKVLYRYAIFFIIAFAYLPASYATNYYFSSTEGDDSRNSFEARTPDSPWRSLEKLNATFHSLNPGDTVFLKRGDVFFGRIHLVSSGTEDRPIVIAAYGSGEAPLISGWAALEEWQPAGEGIYQSQMKATGAKPNVLLIDDRPQPLGKYPDQGYLEYRLGEAQNSLVAAHDYSSWDLKGSTLVVRKNQWILDKHQISDTDGKNIHFVGESKYGGSDGYGFFIQDNKNVLNLFGEWYHDPESGLLYIFTGDKLPSQHTIKVSTTENLLTNAKDVHHIVIENLKFSGANKSAILLQEAAAIQVKQCAIEYSGENGLTGLDVLQLTITGNHISDSQNNGIFLRYGTPNATITNNTITNTHLFHGMGLSGDQNGIGIYSISDDGYIYNNQVKETGYSGIVFSGNRTVVKNNYVNSFCLVKNDGGGIYSYEGAANRKFHGRKIEGNIIVNGRGNSDGARILSKFSYPQVEGIYLDDNANGIEVYNNSVGSVSRNAIHIHNARDIVISKNTLFDAHHQVFISHDALGDAVRNVRISENIFFANSHTQLLVGLMSIKEDWKEMAVFRNNLYLRPKDHEFSFQVNKHNTDGEVRRIPYKFAQWQGGPIDDQGSIEKALDGYSFVVENPRATRRDDVPLDLYCIDSDCELEYAPSGLAKRTSLVSTGRSGSGIKIEVGAVDPISQYVLRLTISNKEDLVVSAILRHNNAPWTYLSELKVFEVGAGSNYIEKIFSYPDESQDAAVILTFQDEDNALTVHDPVWLKASISFDVPEVLFKYNATAEPMEIELDKNYIDTADNLLSKKIILAPFTSKILIQTD